MNALFAGLIAGAFGMAYFVYGKRNQKLVALCSGMALCVYPYFFDSVLWLCVVGVALPAAPFVVDY